jgi:hypothetical protein
MKPHRHHVRLSAVTFAVGVVLWLGASTWLDARVFERGPRVYRAYAAAGLTRIYSGNMDINGGASVMEVFSANSALPTVAAQFGAALKSEAKRVWFHHDTASAYGFAQDTNRLTRFLLVQVEPEQTLLYALHQDYPLKPTAADALPADFPVFPGARVEMVIEHWETRARLATLAVAGTPAIVEAYYRQSLGERGWKPLLPTTDSVRAFGSASQQMFRKRNTLCLITCQPDPVSGMTTVAVLMKDTNL